MLELGKKLSGRLLEIPRVVLTESVPDKVYQLRIETKGIVNEKEVGKAIVTELHNKFRARVIWIRIENGVINLQLIGSPFAWVVLLAFLPTMLAIFGIVVVLISLYSVLAAIPGWAWGLLAVGIGLILFGPTVVKAVTAGYEAKEKYRVIRA